MVAIIELPQQTFYMFLMGDARSTLLIAHELANTFHAITCRLVRAASCYRCFHTLHWNSEHAKRFNGGHIYE